METYKMHQNVIVKRMEFRYALREEAVYEHWDREQSVS